MMDSPALPNFDRPPVIEVVCSAQFEPLEKLTAAHVGVFWSHCRDDYPRTSSAAPLSRVWEESERQPAIPQLAMSFTDKPQLRRTWLESDSWVIQIQADRFLHNWRKSGEQDEYPRFPEVFKRFDAAWTAFNSFVANEALGDVKVNQLEVTYINHIPASDGWSTLANVGNVFPDIAWRNDSKRVLPVPETMQWRVAFPLPDDQGRLHVSIKDAIRLHDNTPVLVCELTARGMPADDSASAIEHWFHMGRAMIVNGFADLTSPEAQKLWERTQ